MDACLRRGLRRLAAFGQERVCAAIVPKRQCDPTVLLLTMAAVRQLLLREIDFKFLTEGKYEKLCYFVSGPRSGL